MITASTKVESMVCRMTVAPSMACAWMFVTFPVMVCAVVVPITQNKNSDVMIKFCFSYLFVFNIFNFDETKVELLFSYVVNGRLMLG